MGPFSIPMNAHSLGKVRERDAIKGEGMEGQRKRMEGEEKQKVDDAKIGFGALPLRITKEGQS